MRRPAASIVGLLLFATASAAAAADVTPLFTLGDEPFLAENVAWDASAGRWLVSSVRRRTIVEVDGRGAVKAFSRDSDLDGVFGLAVDRRRGRLWAATAAAAPADRAAPAGTTALVLIDLHDGRTLARFRPPPDPKRSFGDVALAPDGTVYVSDSGAGELWRLRPGAQALERVSADFRSPQGIVPFGPRLVVADYPSGLKAVDAATGETTMIAAPEGVTLRGIDGLARDGDRVVAVQNGTKVARVLLLEFDAARTRVVACRVLAEGAPALREPTGGVVRGRAFVFVARSQWDAFGGDGALTAAHPEPAEVARLPLP